MLSLQKEKEEEKEFLKVSSFSWSLTTLTYVCKHVFFWLTFPDSLSPPHTSCHNIGQLVADNFLLPLRKSTFIVSVVAAAPFVCPKTGVTCLFISSQESIALSFRACSQISHNDCLIVLLPPPPLFLSSSPAASGNPFSYSSPCSCVQHLQPSST